MTKTICYNVTKTELGGMIKGYLDRQNHRYGGIAYAPKTDSFRLIDMDGDTTVDDIFKDAFGANGYAGYTTKLFTDTITAMYCMG